MARRQKWHTLVELSHVRNQASNRTFAREMIESAIASNIETSKQNRFHFEQEILVRLDRNELNIRAYPIQEPSPSVILTC